MKYNFQEMAIFCPKVKEVKLEILTFTNFLKKDKVLTVNYTAMTTNIIIPFVS